MARVEVCRQRRQVAASEAQRGTDTEMARHHAAPCPQDVQESIGFRANPGTFFIQQFAFVCQPHPARGAIDQKYPVPGFDLLQALRDRGRRNIQFPCRGHHAVGLYKDLEETDVVEREHY